MHLMKFVLLSCSCSLFFILHNVDDAISCSMFPFDLVMLFDASENSFVALAGKCFLPIRIASLAG